MIPDEHQQVTGRADADRRNGDVAMRHLVALKGEGAAPTLAIGPGGCRREKPDIRRHHQQTVDESQRTSLPIAPALAEHIPCAGHGIHAEEPDDPGSDRGMQAAFTAGVCRRVVQRLPQRDFRGEQRVKVAKLAYLWIFARVR